MFEKLNSQKLIIVSLVLFFILGSFWLFFVSAKYLNPDYNSDWWAAYFVNPQNRDLNFAIENHSTKNNFHWEVMEEQNMLQAGDVQIEKGLTKNISVNFQPKDAAQKIIVKVSTGSDDAKEIYKNF